jgi:cell division transport system permease protein
VSDQLTRKRLFTSGITVIISLSLVLFMLGALGLLVINARQLITHYKEDVGFQVYLKDTATSAQTDALIQEISTSKYCKNVSMINKEQAAEKLKKDLGPDFLSIMDSNPLLNCIDVKLHEPFANTDTLDKVSKNMMQKHQSYIKEIVYPSDMIDKLNKNTNTIALFIIIFSGALFVIAIALISNTIRLSIYSQRFLIRTMYLVGATRIFISRPFILKGIRQGIIAGIISGAMLGGFMVLSEHFIPDLLELRDENVLLILLFAMIVVGVIISALSALFSVLRYLRLKTSDLYF